MEKGKEVIQKFLEREQLKGYTHDTIEVKRKNIERFMKYINYAYKKAAKDIVLGFMSRLKNDTISEEKINLHLSHVSQLYEYLIEIEEVLVNPVKGIQRFPLSKESHSGIFSEIEIKEILKASSRKLRRKSLPIMKRDRAILELFYSSGIRLQELLNLNVWDVDFESMELPIYNAKGDKERIVPVGEQALTYLREYMSVREFLLKKGKETDALFLSREGNRLASPSVRKMIWRRKIEAGITVKGTTHAFRRSCASHLLKNGAPLETISRMLGHSTIGTTEIYTEVCDEDLKETYKKSHPRA